MKNIFKNYIEQIIISFFGLGYIVPLYKKKDITYDPIKKHKPENYVKLQNSSKPLILELKNRIDELLKKKNEWIKILDMCCASGRHLNALYESYGLKLDYNGFEINLKNKEVMKHNFFQLYENSNIQYCDIRDFYKKNNKKFHISFSHGRSLDLIKPNFDMIKEICNSTLHFVILIQLSNEKKSSFKRFWDYEFNKNGFKLNKHLYPESSYSSLEVPGIDRSFFFKVYERK